MIKAYIIRANGEATLKEIETAYDSKSDIVGGDPEFLTLTTRLSLCCNEMGKVYGLPVNYVATRILRSYIPASMDVICGDAAICAIDDEGDSCSLTSEQITQINKIMMEG